MAVKEVVLPFRKFPGCDTLLGPEMRSTGEVMGIDKDFASGGGQGMDGWDGGEGLGGGAKGRSWEGSCSSARLLQPLKRSLLAPSSNLHTRSFACPHSVRQGTDLRRHEAAHQGRQGVPDHGGEVQEGHCARGS